MGNIPTRRKRSSNTSHPENPSHVHAALQAPPSPLLAQNTTIAAVPKDNENKDNHNITSSSSSISRLVIKNVTSKSSSSSLQNTFVKPSTGTSFNASKSQTSANIKGNGASWVPDPSGKTPSGFASDIVKKARNASFETRIKLGLFADPDSQSAISYDEAKKTFIEALHKSALLSRCNSDLKEELFRNVVPTYVRKGDLLFEQASYGQILYVVITGQIDARRFEENGQVIKMLYGSGSVLSDACVLMNTQHEYTAIVKEPGLLLAVHRLQYQMAAVNTGHRLKKLRIEKSSSTNVTTANSITTTTTTTTGTSSPPTSTVNDFTSLKMANSILGAQDIDGMMKSLDIPLFAPLTSAQLRLIRKVLVQRTFAPGERIIHATQPSPGLFIILSGEVVLRTPRGVSGEEQKLKSSHVSASYRNFANTPSEEKIFSSDETNDIEWLGQDDYFSEASLLCATPQPLGLDAVATDQGPVNCLLLPADRFTAIANGKNEEGVPILDMIKQIHLERILGRNPLFSRLTMEQVRILARNTQIVNYSAGTQIIKGGSPLSQSPGMFIVTLGLVRINPESSSTTPSSIIPNIRISQKQQQQHAPDNQRRLSEPPVLPQPVISNQKLLVRDHTGALSPGGGNSSSNDSILRGMSFFGFNAAALGSSPSLEEISSLWKSKDFAVLLSGDSFSEESVLNSNHGTSTQVVSAYAMGGVTCGIISQTVLKKLGILDIILATAEEEENGPAQQQGDLGIQQYLDIGKIGDPRKTSNNKTSYSGTLLSVTGEQFKFLKRMHHTDMTDVWIALHKKSGQLIVIKALKVPIANKRGLGRFVFTEQTTLAQLNSPFVAHLVSSWEEQGTIVVALEPVLGGDLASFIRQNKFKNVGGLGCLSLEVIRFYTASLVLALKYLYEHNVCHRDLKPDNVMMDHNNHLKLIDFGLAKQFPIGSTRTTTMCGTPKYMAPELASLALGAASGYGIGIDWWALGCIVYEMSLGYSPFSDESPLKAFQDADDDESFKRDLPKSQRSMHFTFVALSTFTTRNLGVLDPIFEPFKAESINTDTAWMSLFEFISGLLTIQPQRRLGVTYKGPREAMMHSFFQKLETSKKQVLPKVDWDKMIRRKETPPVPPSKLIIDLENVASQAKEIAEAEEQYRSTIFATSSDAPSSPVSSVELQVRDQLETNNSGFMGNQLEKAERARRQLATIRKQQLMRVAFKQGKTGDEVEKEVQAQEDIGDRRSLALSVLRKTAIAEIKHTTMMQSIRATFSEVHVHAASIIQRHWRGMQTRRLLRRERRRKKEEALAAKKIGRAVKKYRLKKQKMLKSDAMKMRM